MYRYVCALLVKAVSEMTYTQGRHLRGAGVYGLPQGFMISVFSLSIVPLIKRETAKMSTAYDGVSLLHFVFFAVLH